MNQGELSRQLQNLVDKGYPQAAGLSTEAFNQLCEPLREIVAELPDFQINQELGTLAFVLVVDEKLVSAGEQMAKVVRQDKKGITKLTPLNADDFSTIATVEIPDSPIYLLVDVDRGNETRNIAPKMAMETIAAAQRSPLTLAEGIALATQFPEFLMKNHCYSLLASRHPGDQCVPAIWINGQNAPNLGWCWNGNPHTWLGSASCSKRVSAQS